MVIQESPMFTVHDQSVRTLKARLRLQAQESEVRQLLEELILILKGEDVTYRIERDEAYRVFEITVTSKLG